MKHATKALVACLGLGLAVAANAETVSVDGNVLPSTCTGQNATVTLTDVSVADFTGTAGTVPSGSSPVPFSFNVNCPAVGVSATVTWDTSAGVDGNNLLINTGTATGVGVRLLDGASNNALTATQTDALSAGNATFGYSAEYVETAASVTPGTVAASVSYTVSYN